MVPVQENILASNKKKLLPENVRHLLVYFRKILRFYIVFEAKVEFQVN